MVIHSAQFVKGVIGSTDISAEKKRPTFAFIGRSNAGKSSVLNSLVGRKDLVRSSSTPGRTQQINYFLVNGVCYFVDLPGYGYAKISLRQREKIQKLLAWYLGSSEVRIDAVLMIIDVNVGLKDNDLATLHLLQEAGRKVIIVANKCDKSGENAVRKQISLIRDVVGESPVISYSAKTKRGREDLLEALSSFLE